MILKLFVLLAAVAQVVAPALLPIGTFEQSIRPFPVFIQPASWAFSVWGVIYVLSLVYAIYQLIPKNDNPTLQQTRLPAALGFSGSILWLFFAGQTGALVWFTFPTLLFIAVMFTFILNKNNGLSPRAQTLSRDILLPYAAWTAIATWINAHTLLVEQIIITSSTLNVISNLFFFFAIVGTTFISFKRCHYNLLYGSVLIWASIGIIAVTITTNLFFAVMAAAYTIIVMAVLFTRLQKTISQS